ncbi:MAG: hypothetical protein KGL39_37275 [Patescibacteria group bacterium]|nr:hypothetical protein [Patescibacteria group bacterium]
MSNPMTNHHRLIYTGWGVIGAILIYVTNNAHAILPLIPVRYQAAFGALVAFLVTIRALNSTPPELKSPSSPSSKENPNGPQT